MIPFPDKQYRIIYADPPWNFSSRRCSTPMTGEQSSLLYPTMVFDELKELPVDEISYLNSTLFLWTTDSHLVYALELMNAWGFNYKTIAFNWLKKTVTGKNAFVMGNWTNKSSEICLLGIKGRPHVFVQSRTVRQLVEAVRRKHSEKPNEVRERIVELMGDEPRIELFARKKVDGWDAWGNEV